MNKYERLKRKVDLECKIYELQIQLKYNEIDDNFDEEGEEIRPESEIEAEIEDLATKRDNSRKQLQYECKCNGDTVRIDSNDKIEFHCSNCLRLTKVTTYSTKK